ncbi:energy-coupling factor transporter transmembrane protein EcfT [Paenibacillus sp. MER TA 81-3]|uniref:energy-coupling factor transporter transmembrane component T family protein n=1 Tax=Paenibacillus sp. MER TA 81-3 TaxID=2939573 RepID=UPI00203FBDB2|nr:energy-coupling factor transporter transmembrane component T [Paenibacillus sp. MER TA 81-3]MCM3342231.1 energy-coupling factor transporter transmembrane protein EcfT [Paenibacillus sp. MER TA 81-3]
MKSMSLYVERESTVHHIDPITKLVYIAAAIALPIILPSIHTAWICMLISFVILGLGRVLTRSLPIIGFVGFILLTVVIIQGFFHVGNETVLFRLGSWPFYEEGLLFAMGITFRALNIVGAFLILVLTTKPSDLVESLVRKGLSPRIGYVLNSVFQIIPQMMSTVDTITDAQRSRGMETEGKLMTRIKAFLPLIGPVVLSSLMDTKERTLALQVRGFNVKGSKTFLNEEKMYRHGSAMRWSMLAIVIGAVIWRVIA